MSDDYEKGFFVFRRVSQTSGTDGSGYVELEYVGHTYGYLPADYLAGIGRMSGERNRGELIFFKISHAIRLKPDYEKIPERTELRGIEVVEEPLTDLRWMT